MKTKLRVSLAFISIFALGLLSGALLRPLLPFGWNGPDHRFEHRQDQNYDDRSTSDDGRMRRIEAHMRQNLELDYDQQQSLFSAIRENRRERRELMEQRREEIKTEMRRQQREFEQQLDEILRPEQRAAWDSLYSREALQERRRD